MSRRSSIQRGVKRGATVNVVSRAKHRYLRGSARKTRLVVDQIRGKPVNEARTLLKMSKRRVASHVLKVLMSAVANTENTSDSGSMVDPDDLFVARAQVDEGPVQKRMRPAPMGRGFLIQKRQCHVMIELGSLAR